MEWPEALEIMVAKTGHERFRGNCSADHPEHLAWRASMVEQVTGAPAPRETSQSYPRVATEVQNLFRSMVRFARSGFRLAPKKVRRARQAQCDLCDKYDPIQRRCKICGCKKSAKVFIAADQCPLDPPKWKAHV